jgi:serine/threonine protein kinase
MQLGENTIVADRFRLHRMIGQGGMGSVWEATQLGLERACALKFIEGEMAKLAEAHARFEREARAAATLNSPHIVQIYDHGVWQGTPYIAMELLIGQNLGDRLTERGGKLDAPYVSRIMQQVSRGLGKAHQAGIVHRDLKPDNVYLVRDEEQEIVKILDFGVAKQTVAGIDGSNTKTGAMLGTPYYMSPEQAQGVKTVDHRSDLWSLAVIVYQCITGRLPFESEALGDLLVKIIVSPIPVPSQMAPNVPFGFDKWWAKAANRDVEQRFQSAKEFNEALQLALGQSSVTEITERRPAVVASTAFMPNRPGVSAHAQTGGAASDPHLTAASAMHTPGTMMSPMAGPPSAMTPAGLSSPMGPGMATPPGTFGGVEPPVELPKKGPPLALLGILGAVAVIGVVLFGTSMMGKPKSEGSEGGAVASATASALPEPIARAAPPPASAEPKPVASAEPASSATAAPQATVTSQAKPGAGQGAGQGGGHGAGKPPPVAVTGRVGASAPPKATGTGAAVKPPVKQPGGNVDFGF